MLVKEKFISLVFTEGEFNLLLQFILTGILSFFTMKIDEI